MHGHLTHPILGLTKALAFQQPSQHFEFEFEFDTQAKWLETVGANRDSAFSDGNTAAGRSADGCAELGRKDGVPRFVS